MKKVFKVIPPFIYEILKQDRDDTRIEISYDQKTKNFKIEVNDKLEKIEKK